MPISRRDFLLRSAGFVSISTLVPRWGVRGASKFEETVEAADPNRILVVLELMGGNDGLTTVVPYTDSTYPQVRSRVGVAQSTVLQLDSRLGLNSVMTGLKSLWDANRVAILEGIGYPNSSLSHFTGRQIWKVADPTLVERLGWLGRWADQAIPGTSNVLACSAVSQSLPLALLANTVQVPTFVTVSSYAYQTDGNYTGDQSNQISAFLAQNADQYEIENTPARVSGLAADAITSSNIMQTVGSGYISIGNYPTNSLGAGLQLIAQMISSPDVQPRILYVTYGGFDLHANGDVNQDPLLQAVSDSIKAFFDDLDGHGKSHDVLLMTWSEFGRRVNDNASNGTDHGTAAPHFVVGDAVKPGIYGSAPSLTNLDANGNLLIQNDFRSYYGTVLSDWLGADSAAVLGAGWPNLGFLNKSYV